MVTWLPGKFIFDLQLSFQSKCVQSLSAYNICVMQILCTQLAHLADLVLESLPDVCVSSLREGHVILLCVVSIEQMYPNEPEFPERHVMKEMEG